MTKPVRTIPLSKPYVGDEERQAVLATLDSGMLVQGARVAELEADFSRIIGSKFAVATSSGTAALHLALLAHGVGPGDEVITTPFTFIASVNAILYVGATPVFCDIDPETFNLDTSQIESLITPRTKAILPVHVFGRACAMAPLMEIATRHQILVIEDCAQSVGARFDGTATGAFGTGCFSLYATKNVMGVEGGIITTNDETVARVARSLRSHGSRDLSANRSPKDRYLHERLGFNLRMSDLHASLAVVQLRRLSAWTAARRAHADAYSRRISSVKLPSAGPAEAHVWHQYTVRIPGASAAERDSAVARLEGLGVGCGVFYPVPASRQPHIEARGFGAVMPVADRLANEVFSIPVHPQLTHGDVDTIVDAVNTL